MLALGAQTMSTPRSPGRRARRSVLPQLRDRLAIGRTGLAVSPVCLGLVRDPDAIEVAFDAGINFFFLSGDLHWPAYDASRRGLAALLARGRSMRDQIVVAAASYVTQREFTRAPFVELLEAMPELQRIDLLVIGGAYHLDFLARRAIYRDFLHRNDFGARGLAASFHDRDAAVAAINDEAIDIAFIRYNPAHPGARSDLFPRLRPSTTRIFNFKSTTGYLAPRTLRALGVPAGHWRPAATDYYRFALSQPAIDGLLCAPSTPREIRALRRALRAPPLTQHEQRYLIELARLSAGGECAMRSLLVDTS
jgi:hypothetical protein